jgi:hypothetical protein
VGHQVILEPLDTWSVDFIATLDGWDDTIERPAQTPVTDLRDPFE